MNPYDKPPLEELMHFGKKGMKWGKRTKRTPEQKQDRKKNREQKILSAMEKLDKSLGKSLDKIDNDYKNDPRKMAKIEAAFLRGTGKKEAAAYVERKAASDKFWMDLEKEFAK